MSETTEQVEFLRERIAEDEALLAAPMSRRMIGRRMVEVPIERLPAYVERDRKRWAAECEAKRRIVGLGPVACPDGIDGHYPNQRADLRCDGCDEAWAADAPWRATLRQLAAVYADHPDYDEEWRP